MSQVCINCKQTMFFDMDTKPTKEGQVYSALGVKEASISKLCEHCFDAITAPFEDPDPDMPWDEYIDPAEVEDDLDRSHEIQEDRLNAELDDRERFG